MRRVELWGLLAYSSNRSERLQNISELNLIMKNPLDSVGTTVTLGVLFASGVPGLLLETSVFDNQTLRLVGGARKSSRVIN